MIGTTQGPKEALAAKSEWGASRNVFLNAVHGAPSKASAGYYYNAHLDYFDKMACSLRNLRAGLKPRGAAILVV